MKRAGEQSLRLFYQKIKKKDEGSSSKRGKLAIYLCTPSGLKFCCLLNPGLRHEKTHALAVEMLNDWDSIFSVLKHPQLPLTNNEAERALRHWVILRKISYGTRTEVGSRVFAILASVIETCRIRKCSPWRYLANVITNRRAGLSVPPLPLPVKILRV